MFIWMASRQNVMTDEDFNTNARAREIISIKTKIVDGFNLPNSIHRLTNQEVLKVLR
jgi:hypothetical protein